MKNQKPRFSFKVFLNLKLWLCLFFLELECFLKSFDAIRAYLSVTLLARFNKDWLIFSNTTLNKTII
ncbi:hypothetical protein CV729_04075 [Helicobacter pylori]|nr:hypothetical protein [Helicobacter pylori]QDY62270.1 hypothetical protein CV729_04075 [Helicobacter pylori]